MIDSGRWVGSWYIIGCCALALVALILLPRRQPAGTEGLLPADAVRTS